MGEGMTRAPAYLPLGSNLPHLLLCLLGFCCCFVFMSQFCWLQPPCPFQGDKAPDALALGVVLVSFPFLTQQSYRGGGGAGLHVRLRQGGRHETAVDGREWADDDPGLQLLQLLVVIGTERRAHRE